MPTASLDFTLASLVIIMVTAGAIYGVKTLTAPYLDNISTESRYYQIGRSILLSEGNPVDWGKGIIPTSFGLADESSKYSLDIDKVSRLNPENEFALNYSTIWRTLGIEDISFTLEISPVYILSLKIESFIDNGYNTTYNFLATCTLDGYPIESNISYYLCIRSSTYSITGTTDNDGKGFVQFSLPNSISGTALLIGFSKTQDSIFTYNVLSFAHQSLFQQPNNAYATLNPLNYVLYTTITKGSALFATVYSYSYVFNLTSSDSEYLIPTLKGGGPMILVLTGVDGAYYWAEYVAYPQVPLEIGAVMTLDYLISDISSFVYLVDVEGSLYRLKIQFRSPEKFE